jgi:uncharacterized protein with HEPN domain
MNERDETRLRDMLDASRRARAFSMGKTRTDLEKDQFLLGFAIVRAIEIVGEAASQVTPETVASLPEIPWKQIVGMRHRVVHNYNRVDYDIVWDVVTRQIPELIALLEAALPPETDASEPE